MSVTAHGTRLLQRVKLLNSIIITGMEGEWTWPLICPVCAAPLSEGERTLQCARTLKCASGHSYDIAREGYVNLLLRHKKLPPTVGDAPEMLRARREFLEGGFYAPLSDRLNEIVADFLTERAAPVVSVAPIIVEAGCGEGYYLARLAQRLSGSGAVLFGLDVSKTAVRMAAGRGGHGRYEGNGRYLVTDINGKLPFANHSVHVLLNIFAPRHAAEFARILVAGGLLLVALPAAAHLQTVRDRFGLLSIQAEKQAYLLNQLGRHFQLQKVEPLQFELQLPNQALDALIQMTPSGRRLSPAQREQIQNTATFTTEASFEIVQLTCIGG